MSALDDAAAPTDTALRNLRWRFAGLVLDGSTLELTLNSQGVRIEPKPLELLLCLLRHPGEVVTKEELHQGVWPGRILSESVLTKTMTKLRQCLGDESQELIKTVHGYGYRLVAPVTVEQLSAASTTPRAQRAAGDVIAHRPLWRLKSALGHGGHGDVWLGEHEKTGEQRVFKFALDAAGLVALKRELTLYRVLRHSQQGERTDVVRLMDYNLEEPPYFIETEYVAGGSLPHWLALQEGCAAVALPQRLTLVAQVAESLAAAHSAGVLHKDLKPSNILIATTDDGSPQAKLGDFGSGRMLDIAQLEALDITRLGFTQTVLLEEGNSSGTPLYLAPELLSGQQPTVQSDLYALGVVLYQMVVADFKQPLAPGWERRVEDPLLRQDIAALADVDPSRRLADAGALARRLRTLPERHQQAAAEAAKAAESETLRKALQRASARRRLLRAVAVTTSIGLGFSLWQFAAARRAQAAAEASATEARAIARFVTDDLLHLADPFGATRPQLTVRDLLDEASRRVETSLPEQPTAQAQILRALAEAYEGLGDWQKSGELHAAALARAEAAEGAQGDTALRMAEGLAYAHTLNGRYAEAGALYARVLEGTKRLGSNHELILDARDGHAFLDYERGHYAEAADAYEQLAVELSHLHMDERLTAVNWSLPDIYLELGRDDEAEALIVAALEKVSAQSGPRHPQVLWMRLTLGDVLMNREDWDGADAIYLDSLAGLTESLGAMHPNTLTALHYHGHLLLKRGHAKAALPVLEEAYRGRRRVHGDAHPYSRYSAHRLGQALTQLGRLDEALPLLESTLQHIETLRGPEHPNALDLRCSLAEALLAVGNSVRARQLMDEALPWAQPGLPAQSPRLKRFLAVQARAAAS